MAHAVLGPNVLTQPSCSLLHGCIASGLDYCRCQAVRRQLPPIDGSGAYAEILDALCPEGLVAEEWTDDGRLAGTQGCAGV